MKNLSMWMIKVQIDVQDNIPNKYINLFIFDIENKTFPFYKL